MKQADVNETALNEFIRESNFFRGGGRAAN